MYNLRKRKATNSLPTSSNKKIKLNNNIKNKKKEELCIKTSYEESSEDESSDKDYDPDSESEILEEIEEIEDESENNESSETEDYLEKDLSSKNVFINCLKKLIPNSDQENIEKSVNKNFKKHIKNLKPGEKSILSSLLENDEELEDETSFSNLSEKESKILQKELKELREEIKINEPTLEKILKSKILKSDKIEALQFYDSLEFLEIGSREYLSIQKDINTILLSDSKLNNENLKKYQKLEDDILKINPNYQGSIKHKILELDASVDIKSSLYDMYRSMLSKKPESDEYYSIKNKLEFAIDLPHDRMKLPEIKMDKKSPNEIRKYCNTIYEELDKYIFGLENVKERLIEIINNRIYNPKSKSLIAFLGPPGVGKTFTPSILAKILGLPFDRISLGGLEDPSVIKGSENVWVGSNPGIILRMLKKMKYSNGIVLLDEIDKIDKRVQDSILNIIDYTQNHEVDDRYLSEYKHNLSNIWFMVTMNSIKDMDPALLDRLDIIEIPSYTLPEKIKIIEDFMIPKVNTDLGIKEEDLSITNEACERLMTIINDKIKDKGLRALEKEIRQLVSKINLLRTFGNDLSKEKLTYNLSDFKGFPYTISTYTINCLCQKKINSELDAMVAHMYL